MVALRLEHADRKKRLTFWPLVAATFFMVSGGTYGTEDIVHSGYRTALIVMLLTPVLWALPTTLMVGELSAALPHEGGFYAWVRRALGDFWGFLEAWLSLVASIFDMAIYPTLFLLYLGRLFPWMATGSRGIVVGLVMIASCALINIAGIRSVVNTTVGLFLALSAPFAAIVILALVHPASAAHEPPAAASDVGLLGGVLVTMWNYMGWDNASTVAAEVDRPQRTYPRAMLTAVAVVAISYVLPVLAAWRAGIPARAFETGAWATVAGTLGGPALRTALVVGGMLSAFGMFNALVLSYSRLPLAMARDGLLPRAFARLHPRTRTPWVSITVLAAAWALCLGIGFERLVTLDILLYGLSLLLEFIALVVLRWKAPGMPRPFKVPGGIFGVILIAIPPMALVTFAFVHAQGERAFGVNSGVLGGALVAFGVVAFGIQSALRNRLSIFSRSSFARPWRTTASRTSGS
jgi:amino acid transporter